MHELFRNKINKSELVYSVTLTFLVAVYAPLELYFANIKEFWFSLQQFYMIPIATFIVLAIILIIITNLGYKVSDYIIAIENILTFGIFIQGDFLNIDVGVMNGADIEWGRYLRSMIIDVVVWVCLALLIAVLYVKKKEKVKKVLLFCNIVVMGIMITTLMVLAINAYSSKSPQVEEFVMTDKDVYVSSTDDNIVVFILDMFDEDYLCKLLEKRNDISDRLDGFTFYDNYTGTYSTTQYSMAHLFSGEKFFNQKPFDDWIIELNNERLYVDELVDAGYDLYYYTDMLDFVPQKYLLSAKNRYNGNYVISDKGKFIITLYKLAGCKYLPNCFKPFIWLDGTEFDSVKGCDGASIYIPVNYEFGSRMSDEFECNDRKSIKYIYLNGTHYPYTTNSKGHRQTKGTISSLECAEGVMEIVLGYCDKLKECGTYDNTSIIITADHGYYWDGTLNSPVMLVKPRDTNGRLQISYAPTCQSDFGATILELAGLKSDEYGLSVQEVNSEEERERLFYQYNLSEDAINRNYRLIEYTIDSEGNEVENFHLTDKEYTEDGSVVEHIANCATCESGADFSYDKDYPRLRHDRK